MADDQSLALAAVASLSVSEANEGGKCHNEKPKDDVFVDDPDLWKPGPPPEDCPVCMAPLPISNSQSTYFPCCGKMICTACEGESTRANNIINSKRAKKELPPVEEPCAFCRTPLLCDASDRAKQCLLRTQKNDCSAYLNLSKCHQDGFGLPKDESKALDLLHRAAELDSAPAMKILGDAYRSGDFGVKQDLNKAREQYKRSAKRGYLSARLSLAHIEHVNDNTDLAIRHLRLAAEGGLPEGMKVLWGYFYEGQLSKDDLEVTLRAYQNAITERNSEDRERCSAYEKALEGDDATLQGFYVEYYEGNINAKKLNEFLKAYKSKP